MNEPTKGAWSRPELIVLVRSGPEEAVLEACKLSDDRGGPGTNTSACNRDSGPCYATLGS
jgi:hypothetical protein